MRFRTESEEEDELERVKTAEDKSLKSVPDLIKWVDLSDSVPFADLSPEKPFHDLAPLPI